MVILQALLDRSLSGLQIQRPLGNPSLATMLKRLSLLIVKVLPKWRSISVQQVILLQNSTSKWQTGRATLQCRGFWRSFEDVTYLCDGKLTEDTNQVENDASTFSKVSHCDGSIAITPLSAKFEDGIAYYGLTEMCNGGIKVDSHYSREQYDHRVLAWVVDQKMVQQMICLMKDKTCAYLHLSDI